MNSIAQTDLTGGDKQQKRIDEIHQWSIGRPKEKLNTEMVSQLKRLLLRLGGDDFPNFIRVIIKRLLTGDLAMEFSWRGTKNKPSIQKCFFITVLKATYFIFIKIPLLVHNKFQHVGDRSFVSTLFFNNTLSQPRIV
ncbi:uncharacterized protein LOC131994306 [Stomoxys calcitrans]|uniref:uncharacterized protein LOC131994306 n=1 Tax=Stomoxys calcitrans TaxID=35570 RepID=UPI0027E2613B|nr:uncharacterized protein LOC131994306 [Stomoxys calcitrans]